jgi:hypothetical protein
MRSVMLLALASALASLVGACDKGGAETAPSEPAHPLLVAKCKAGTTSACQELEQKCKDGDQSACDEHKKIKDTRKRPMSAPTASAE